MGSTDVLILGAGGRVGQALSHLLPRYGLSVRGVPHRRGASGTGVDVCCEDELVACVAEIDARVVIYAAAIADPDRCERDPAASYAVNVTGASRLAAAADRHGCRIIYYSSDYVFSEPGRYFEDAQPAPLQVYGRHKAEAEQLLLEHRDNVVIRLPLLFGSRDFIAEAVRAIAHEEPLSSDDRRRYPIPLEHVAQVTGTIICTGGRPGIYHAVGVDAVTKAEWASYIARLLEKPVPQVAGPVRRTIARRPSDVELATRYPEMRADAGTLWTATRRRVAELVAGSD